MSKKIYLSPSNQGGNIYAAGGTNEKVQCNRIANHAKIALERCGFQVKKAPEGQAMNTSISESNTWKSDLHIPLHSNAGGGQGTEILVWDSKANPAANAILGELVKITLSGKNRGIKVRQDLAEIRGTTAMCLYLEVDFHDNASVASWIISNVKSIGEAITKGICNYYGVTYKPESGGGNPEPTGKLYRVQIGAFSVKSNAENCLKKARDLGFQDAFILEG